MVLVIGRADFLVVGDCKLASLENRAQIQAGGGYYLAPLPMTGATPEELRLGTQPTPARVWDCLGRRAESRSVKALKWPWLRPGWRPRLRPSHRLDRTHPGGAQ